MEVPSTINLNVGGKIYTTKISTLTRQPNSIFTAMFRERSEAVYRDPEGNVFIDRDGKNFRFVLNFLRSSELNLPRDFQDFKHLASDAEFYRLPALKKAIEKQKESMKTEAVEFIHVTFQSDRTVVKGTINKVSAHLWKKVTVVARRNTLREIFPDNGKAIQENVIYKEDGLDLELRRLGHTIMPSYYGRLQERLSSLEFQGNERMEEFQSSLCLDFHKWLLALFSSNGFELKGANENTTTLRNATEYSLDWYFVRK